MVIASLYLLRFIEDRLLYPLAGRAVGLSVAFRSSGYGPLTELLGALQQAHVEVKEVAVMPGDEEKHTIHVLLRLPRGLDVVKLTALVGDLEQVRSISLD